MTYYLCGICGKVHNSTDPPCPITISATCLTPSAIPAPAAPTPVLSEDEFKATVVDVNRGRDNEVQDQAMKLLCDHDAALRAQLADCNDKLATCVRDYDAAVHECNEACAQLEARQGHDNDDTSADVAAAEHRAQVAEHERDEIASTAYADVQRLIEAITIICRGQNNAVRDSALQHSSSWVRPTDEEAWPLRHALAYCLRDICGDAGVHDNTSGLAAEALWVGITDRLVSAFPTILCRQDDAQHVMCRRRTVQAEHERDEARAETARVRKTLAAVLTVKVEVYTSDLRRHETSTVLKQLPADLAAQAKEDSCG